MMPAHTFGKKLSDYSKWWTVLLLCIVVWLLCVLYMQGVVFVYNVLIIPIITTLFTPFFETSKQKKCELFIGDINS